MGLGDWHRHLHRGRARRNRGADRSDLPHQRSARVDHRALAAFRRAAEPAPGAPSKSGRGCPARIARKVPRPGGGLERGNHAGRGAPPELRKPDPAHAARVHRGRALPLGDRRPDSGRARATRARSLARVGQARGRRTQVHRGAAAQEEWRDHRRAVDGRAHDACWAAGLYRHGQGPQCSQGPLGRLGRKPVGAGAACRERQRQRISHLARP
jgi:hypothetical protein